jgi:Bacterial dnaA protein helix-turn-helix
MAREINTIAEHHCPSSSPFFRTHNPLVPGSNPGGPTIRCLCLRPLITVRHVITRHRRRDQLQDSRHRYASRVAEGLRGKQARFGNGAINARHFAGVWISTGLETVERTEMVSEHFYLREMRDPELTVRTNRCAYVFPRQLAMYIARQLTGASLEEIGREFGGRHYSTVLCSINKIEAMRRSDDALNCTITRMVGAVVSRTRR